MDRSRLGHGARCLALVGAVLLCTVSAQAADYYHARWALLVGVGQFKNDRIPKLRFCTRDVKDMRQLLVDRFAFPADHVTTLTDEQATREGMLRQLNRLADRRLVQPDDAVLVYFSGHGQTVPLPRAGGAMGFLIPYDAAPDVMDPENAGPYADTCISMEELRRLSELIPARHVIFLVDACYSGLAIEGRRGAPRPAAAAAAAASRPVREIIVAGRRDQKSLESDQWQHGAFTYALLRGLESGTADFGQDGVVTGLELATYLQSAVPRLADQSPQFGIFEGDGDFLFSYGTPSMTAVAESEGPRISLVDPPEGAGEEVTVLPVGGSAVLKGVVVDAAPVTSLTLDGKELALVPATGKDLGIVSRKTDRHAYEFSAEVAVGLGERKTVVLRARNDAGQPGIRRITVAAEAADTQPPQVRLEEVRVTNDRGTETEWHGLTVAQRGITASARGLTASSRAILASARPRSVVTLAGFARDDRAVVSVQVDGRPVTCRPATREQLDGLGWDSGVAFECALPPLGAGATEVTATARDAAGNEGRATLTVEHAEAAGPEVVILVPRQTRGLRGTGLFLPSAKASLRIAGLAHSGVPIKRVEVGGRRATLRPATKTELTSANWAGEGIYFEADATVPPTGVTEGILVEAVDEAGKSGTRTVLAQRQGPPLHVEVTSARPTYRFDDGIHFRMLADRECYAYLFHREADGTLSLFLPNPVEPDMRLPAAVARVFPDPAEEARYAGQYGLRAQEPAGTDTVYCLAVQAPLPAAQVANVLSLKSVGAAIAAAGAQRGTAIKLPATVDDSAVSRAAKELGGAWVSVKYEVKR